MTWGSHTDEHEAREQLTAFIDAGGTLLDTAHGYAGGASEELLGKLLGDVVSRDETWSWRPRPGSARAAARAVIDTSRGYLLSCLDASLQRLGVDHVDLWQVHVWSDDDPDRGDPLGAGHRGRDRPGGVRRRLELVRLAAPRRPPPGSGPCPAGRRWSSTQVEYSLLNRAVEHEVRPGRRPRSASASCPGRRSAAGCSPASTAPAPRRTPAAPRRHCRSSSTRYLDEPSSAVVEAVVRAADGLGWTPLEVALAWVRDRPGVTAPILGARTAAQLRQALARRGARRCPLS